MSEFDKIDSVKDVDGEFDEIVGRPDVHPLGVDAFADEMPVGFEFMSSVDPTKREGYNDVQLGNLACLSAAGTNKVDDNTNRFLLP